MVRVGARIVSLDIYDAHYTSEDLVMELTETNRLRIWNEVEPLFDHIITRTELHGVLFFTECDFDTFRTAISRLIPCIFYAIMDEHGPAGFSQ